MSSVSTTVPRPAVTAIDKKTYGRLNVMVVEDAAHMSSLVCGILKSLGFGRIFEARHGNDALAILASQAIDMVVIDDLGAPLEGLAVVKQLRTSRLATQREVPVVFITSKTEESAIFKARDSGVTEILSKPFSAAQLITRIESVLMKPRPLVRASDFVGPDRRRRERDAPERRRKSDLIDGQNA